MHQRLRKVQGMGPIKGPYLRLVQTAQAVIYWNFKHDVSLFNAYKLYEIIKQNHHFNVTISSLNCPQDLKSLNFH